MRLLTALCLAAFVALSAAQPASEAELLGGEAGIVGYDGEYHSALRFLQDSNTTDTPTPTPSTATPTPTPTTATPTPTPTTATPTPTPTATPETTTETPTETPEATTATPEATTATPESTTATPTTDTPTSTPTVTESPIASASESASASASASAEDDQSAGSASAGSADEGSSMSTAAVIGIVVGIIVGVAVIAIIVMFVIRRRRDNDEDPLSPFELSMDKGYSATPGFAPQSSYNPRADAAAAAAARDQRLESGSIETPGSGGAAAAAAGVAYSQFYEQQTSPDHGAAPHPYQAQYTTQSSADSYATGAAAGGNTHSNGTNLWMSAMEPKENDSYLSAHEADDKSERSNISSRNSYDAAAPNDASSEISGASDLNSGKDFPDYDEHHSSRGSYEL